MNQGLGRQGQGKQGLGRYGLGDQGTRLIGTREIGIRDIPHKPLGNFRSSVKFYKVSIKFQYLILAPPFWTHISNLFCMLANNFFYFFPLISGLARRAHIDNFGEFPSRTVIVEPSLNGCTEAQGAAQLDYGFSKTAHSCPAFKHSGP